MLSDVRTGLSSTPRQISSKYFYDERGSQLFDEITRLPEYYPTRAERALLERCAATIVDTVRPVTLVELGAGSSDKTRLLLDQMVRRSELGTTYIPVDVSAEFLASSTDQLRIEYPSVETRPVVADFSSRFELPAHSPPALHAFLGSTIGNFTPSAAVDLVRKVCERMAPEDYFLLGVDLRKNPHQIEAAYNDSQGVTASFNRNMLDAINAGLGANFNSSRFDHKAIYNATEHRIEMWLVSQTDQVVEIPGIGSVTFDAGDELLTELSYKYDRELATELLTRSGLHMQNWFTDDAGLFALTLATRDDGA
jgi:L-histidine N-alpha-methyltransferase